MDCCQILLVSIFHVLHIAILYLLRHDDCGCDAKPPYCRDNSELISYNMESIFRIHNAATCKYFPVLMCRFSRVQIYLTITNSFFIFPFTFINLLGNQQRIPVWWRWYYWACPIAWTLYGLIASQFGDIEKFMTDGNREPVKEYIKSSFGYKHDFLGVVAVVVAGTAVLFAFIFAVSIKVFNFQRR